MEAKAGQESWRHEIGCAAVRWPMANVKWLLAEALDKLLSYVSSELTEITETKS